MSVAGTVAAALPDERVTTVPAAGAGALIVTVAVEVVPLLMLVGLKTMDATELARMLSAIVPENPFSVAVTVTGVVAATELVVTVKYELEFAPAAIVTVEGTTTLGSDDVSVTTIPPAGAIPAVKTLI